MTQKKKPEGKEWEEFVNLWYASNHEGKVKLAERYEVGYDTLKHWVSDSGSTRKQSEPRMTITIPELLSMRPSVNLDFACFDIESSNLTADFSIMLTAAVKPYGQDTIVFRADNYPEWETERDNDSGIVRDVAEELRKHAIIVTHYGSDGRFDLPFLRAKMVKYCIEPLPQMFAIDSWQIAKKRFALSSNRLKNLADFFDIGEKGQVEGKLWMAAAYRGDREAMDKIVEHNIVDVEVLERLACITFPYLRSISKL